MTHPHLDTRVIRILRWLLDQSRPRSTASLAHDLGLSQRVVRYRLDAVDSFLAPHGLTLERQRGSGLWIDADEETRHRVLAEITEPGSTPRVYAPEERDHVLLAAMLWAAPEATSLDRLHDELEVSKASARRDLKRNEDWLEKRELVLVRRPGVGVSVVGNEGRIRQALVHLSVESVPEDVLHELCRTGFADAKSVRVRVPAGIREHLQRLPMQQSSEIVRRSTPPGVLSEGANELVLVLYVAIAAARLAMGRTIFLETGLQRSLIDHPVSAAAESIADEFAGEFDIELPDLEVAGITEYLLGLAALSGQGGLTGGDHEQLLDHMMSVAAASLHETLKEDAELRRSLSQHLDRLSVRLRYGLPVHNPLLHEVRERYPDVHAVALGLGDSIAKHLGGPIVEDELGYITMYLSGALERIRLRPSKRAIVVCPSGMATVWVLVSRIQTEFPQLELIDVLSTRAFEALEHLDVDLVITTVEIPDQLVPVAVVNPLLPPVDVKRILALI